MFVNLLVVKKGLHFFKEFMKVRGIRIKRTNEVFNNIKLIKSYSLERFFLKKIIDIRKDELNWLKKLFYRNIFTMVNSNIGPGVFLLTIFMVYVWAGYQLTAGKIFTTISIFNSFIWALNYLPNIFTNFIDMLISSERLTKYLLSPEIEKWPNLFDEKTLRQTDKNDPKVISLFREELEEEIEEREEFMKRMQKEYFDPQDGKEVALVSEVETDNAMTLFDYSYDVKERKEVESWEMDSQKRRRFEGSLLDVQIKNLDFFWKKFWVPKTEEELKIEKEEKEKKEKMKKMKIAMGMKKESKTESTKSDESGNSIDDKFHLKNVNLEIEKGEFVGVIGKSGSGKSSLFQAILGELFATYLSTYSSSFVSNSEFSILGNWHKSSG